MPSTVATQTYTLSATAGSVTVPAFTISGTTPCLANDIVYTAVTTPLAAQASTPITFAGMIVTWQTTNAALVGAYSITVTGTVSSATVQSAFMTF